jgi:competence ComEA-like helix-hairpin-helix protein
MLLRRIRIRYFFSLLFLSLIVSASATAGKKKPPAQPININTANSEQLQQVPGIGPATADKILQMRKSYGPFKSVDDLLAIRGLGAKRLEKMRKYLTVGGPTQSKKPASPIQKPSTPQSSSPRSSSFLYGGGICLPSINTR